MIEELVDLAYDSSGVGKFLSNVYFYKHVIPPGLY